EGPNHGCEGTVANYRKQESLDSQVTDFPIHGFRILPRKGNFATEPRVVLPLLARCGEARCLPDGKAQSAGQRACRTSCSMRVIKSMRASSDANMVACRDTRCSTRPVICPASNRVVACSWT